MSEFYINLFEQEDYAGTNKPHYKALFKIDGVEHECAFGQRKKERRAITAKQSQKCLTSSHKKLPQREPLSKKSSAYSLVLKKKKYRSEFNGERSELYEKQ